MDTSRQVAAGRHRVELLYRPPRFLAGLATSALALARVAPPSRRAAAEAATPAAIGARLLDQEARLSPSRARTPPRADRLAILLPVFDDWESLKALLLQVDDVIGPSACRSTSS